MAKVISSARAATFRKAAIFMISVGAQGAAQLYKHLPEEDIEKLSTEIAKLDNVNSSELAEINEDFHNMVMAQQYITAGGINYAQEVLEAAMGHQKALEIIRRVQMTLEVKGFNILENVDTTQLLAFLQKEHSQTIALVLSQLTPIQAASIISELSPSTQIDVVHRIARMERVSPDTLKAVEKVLETHIDFAQSSSKLGGVKTAAEIVNMVGQRFEKNIINGIAKEDPQLAGEIKNLMFVFEDMIKLDNRSIQKVLKEVDNKELAMALKACSENLKEKVLSNMSKRASDMIREELDYMGPVRLREVETVQQHVIDVIRRLEEEGEIVISTGADEDQMV